MLLAPLLLSFLLLSSFSLPASFLVRVLAAGSMVYIRVWTIMIFLSHILTDHDILTLYGLKSFVNLLLIFCFFFGLTLLLRQHVEN